MNQKLYYDNVLISIIYYQMIQLLFKFNLYKHELCQGHGKFNFLTYERYVCIDLFDAWRTILKQTAATN